MFGVEVRKDRTDHREEDDQSEASTGQLVKLPTNEDYQTHGEARRHPFASFIVRRVTKYRIPGTHSSPPGTLGSKSTPIAADS